MGRNSAVKRPPSPVYSSRHVYAPANTNPDPGAVQRLFATPQDMPRMCPVGGHRAVLVANNDGDRSCTVCGYVAHLAPQVREGKRR